MPLLSCFRVYKQSEVSLVDSCFKESVKILHIKLPN